MLTVLSFNLKKIGRKCFQIAERLLYYVYVKFSKGLSVLKNKKNTNITHLNKYSINKTLENIRQYKRKKFVRLRAGVITVAGLVLIGIAGLPLLNNNQETLEFNQLHAKAANDLKELEQERQELEYQVGLLEDEEYIAKLARKELNLSQPNEILINLPEEEAVDAKEVEQNNEEEENESE